MRMAPPSKTKTSKSRSQPSVPCEVFFACTLCGERCRTVPKLYSHYRSVHREEVLPGESRRLQDKGTAGSDSAECKDRGGKSPKSASTSGSPGRSQTRDKDGTCSNLARRQSPNSDSSGNSPLRSQTEGREVVKTTKISQLDCSGANLPLKGNEKETEKQGMAESVQRDLSEKAEIKDGIGGKIKNGDSNDLAQNTERSRKQSKSDFSEGSSTNGKEQRLRAESGDRGPSENSPIDKLEDRTSDRERSDAMEYKESSGTSPKSNSSESSPGNGSKVGKEKHRRADGRKGESCSGKKKLKRGDDSPQGRDESSSKKPGEEERVTRSSRVDSTDGTTTRYTVTRKKNVPLGMLEGKKNSLMVIFQHAERNKPLPEGSSFKLRNTGGEQTYLVVANVDVEITDCEKIVTKA